MKHSDKRKYQFEGGTQFAQIFFYLHECN